MIEISSMPLLPGATSGRTVATVDASKLNEIGVNGGAFAIHSGDTIKFYDDEPLVVCQPINTSADSPKAYYVAVERNGEKSWLGIGILTRRDGHAVPLGKFQEEMLTKPSFKEVYGALRGKTIKGGALKQHEFSVFENGKRVEGKYNVRSVPEIEKVGW